MPSSPSPTRLTSAQLRASEAKFASILDIAADAIISIDKDQRIVHFNKGAEQIFDYPADEMIGQPLSRLLPQQFRQAHTGHMHAFSKGNETARRMGERREIFGLRRGEIEFPAEASISKLDTPEGQLFTVVLRDITDRKRAEWEHRILSTMSDRLARSIDYEETIHTVANTAVPELADGCILDIIEPDNQLRRIVSEGAVPELQPFMMHIGRLGSLDWDSPSCVIDVLRTGQPEFVQTVTEEWLEAHADDQVHANQAWKSAHIESLIMIPLVVRGSAIGVLTLLRRSPKRRYQRNDLVFAEECARRLTVAVENARLYQAACAATEAREEILSVVSHDLRNPISAISMCGRVLRDTPPEDPAVRRELTTAIIKATEWMHRLIQDLRDVSMLESRRLSIERHPEDLFMIITTATGLVAGAAQERAVEISVAPLDRPIIVEVDAGRIIQVLTNILGNAIKFTEADGQVNICTSLDRWTVTVRVKDTGIGISPEDQAHVFDQYWQARPSPESHGSGLGLAIAKGIIEAHGGQIWVESQLNEGSVFGLTLPLVLPAET